MALLRADRASGNAGRRADQPESPRALVDRVERAAEALEAAEHAFARRQPAATLDALSRARQLAGLGALHRVLHAASLLAVGRAEDAELCAAEALVLEPGMLLALVALRCARVERGLSPGDLDARIAAGWPPAARVPDDWRGWLDAELDYHLQVEAIVRAGQARDWQRAVGAVAEAARTYGDRQEIAAARVACVAHVGDRRQVDRLLETSGALAGSVVARRLWMRMGCRDLLQPDTDGAPAAND